MLTLEQKIQVLNHLMPDCSRLIENGELIWLDERPLPTELEMETVWAEIHLDDLIKKKREEIDNKRDLAFDTGMPWTFGGVNVDYVQTRERDRINLIAISVASILSIMNNTPTEPVVLFRSANNNDYQLLPTEAVEMGVTAMGFISQVYQYSWDLKDALNEATTVEDVEAVVWNWIPPWEL